MTSLRPSTALGRSTKTMADVPDELVLMFFAPFTEWEYSDYPSLADDANLLHLSNLSKVCKKWREDLRPFLYTTYIDPVTLDDVEAKRLTVNRRLRFMRTILADPDLAARITAFKLDGRIAHLPMTAWEKLNRPIPPFPSDSLLRLLPNLKVLHLPIVPLRYGAGNIPLFIEVINNHITCMRTFPQLKKLVLCCSGFERMGRLFANTVVDLFEHPTLDDFEIRDSTIRPFLVTPQPMSRSIRRLCLHNCNAGPSALTSLLGSCSGLQSFEYVESHELDLPALYRASPMDRVQWFFDILSQHGSTLEVLKLDWRDLSPDVAFARPQLCEVFGKLRYLEIPEVVLMGDLEHSDIAVKEGLELYHVTEHTPETIGELLETIPSSPSDTTSPDATRPTALCLAEILPVSLVSLHIIHCFPGIHHALSSLNTSKRLINLKNVSVELLGLGDSRVKSGGWFNQEDDVTKGASDKVVANLEQRLSKWYVRRDD